MFRNHYDTDVTVWSPDGKLFQVDYAMEAIKQGACTCGAVSKTHVVIVALKRSPDKTVSRHLSKMFPVDQHMGISIAGLAPDARVLARHMRTESMNHRYSFGTQVPTERVVRRISDKAQKHTQRAGSRPYGVGMLVAGFDAAGPHLFQTCPSGNYYDFRAAAIGARSQPARTYFERHIDEQPDMSLEQLRLHCLAALAATAAEGQALEPAAVSVLEVGEGTPLRIYDTETETAPLLEAHHAAMAVAGEGAEGDEGAGAAAMQVD
eukprot:TRINITY_DN32726_c0_g1_i1.p1 TRINITY_DN32726_c0_g1~~TRINITY_DN32726_c0_g1_i1.p1  ORF type:complete len:264 (+),score=48.49 TRINITY_DN32726_c0_g1_i1:121-912(+)